MSETHDDQTPRPDDEQQSTQQEIAELQEELDDLADGDGLAAEAGRGEENGLSEG